MAETVYPRAYGVAEITYYLKQYLEEDGFLAELAVAGEISGYKAHSSGHCYFMLREGESGLKAVMFRRYAAALSWQPRDGDRAMAVGGISLYERDGSCQLYVRALLPAGAGREARQLAELRKRLEAEGLFSPERKRPLPRFALSVGVVTSEQAAAWADIRRIAYQRHPGLSLTLYPALVQGEQAPLSLASAIARADRGNHDVLIVGRGGGADADLAAFNTEAVVRAVAAACTPVVSAVGHESDFTLCDLAADMRAATPTHAAGLATPDRAELLALLEAWRQRLDQAAARRLDRASQGLDQLERRLQEAFARGMEQKQRRLAEAAARLELLSPLATLARGYCLALDAGGNLIGDAGALQAGDTLDIYPAKGHIKARAEAIDGERRF